MDLENFFEKFSTKKLFFRFRVRFRRFGVEKKIEPKKKLGKNFRKIFDQKNFFFVLEYVSDDFESNFFFFNQKKKPRKNYRKIFDQKKNFFSSIF